MNLEEEAERVAIIQQMRHEIAEAALRPMSLEQYWRFVYRNLLLEVDKKAGFKL